MKTRREIVGEYLTDFFNFIGVDPLNGFLFIVLVVLVFELKSLKNFDELSEFKKSIKVIEFILLIGMVILYFFIKSNQ
jgi:L-asparagine transporter-like permease